MLRYIGPREIDRARWDALITKAPNGLIYALSWYLDIVSPGWAALVKQEQGRYVAGLPLPVHTKFGLSYLQQPLLTQQLGLFYVAAAPPTADDWQQIGRLLRRQFRVVTRYSFNTANAELLGDDQLGLADANAERATFKTYHLSLRPAYPQLLSGYTPNRRWRLNQARRRNLQIEPTADIDLLVRLFADNTAGKIYGLTDDAYKLLRAVYDAASRAGLAAMWQARLPGGAVMAMILLLRFKGRLTYLFSAADAAGKQAGAISVLLDNVFRAHAGQELDFDFEAPQVESVAHFYRSFGPVAAPFPTIAFSRLPWPLAQFRAARAALYRRLRSHPQG